jgi:hypothetical protein
MERTWLCWVALASTLLKNFQLCVSYVFLSKF